MQMSRYVIKYAPFVHKQFPKTCNTFFVCLDASNQLSNYHGDI